MTQEPGQARRNGFTWQWGRDPAYQIPPCLPYKYCWVQKKIQHRVAQCDMCNTGRVCRVINHWKEKRH